MGQGGRIGGGETPLGEKDAVPRMCGEGLEGADELGRGGKIVKRVDKDSICLRQASMNADRR